MKNTIYKLLFLGIGAAALTACDDGADTGTSKITTFDNIPVVMDGTPMVISENDADTYTFRFTTGNAQITDLHLVAGTGVASTATEGVDFEFHTHEFDIPALGGQDGFEVEIEVLEDLEIEGGNETIYLAFTTEAPSGIQTEEVLAITIQDSGRDGVGFELSWALADELPTTEEDIEACDVDIDFTIQTPGGDPYDDDLLGFAMASGECVEHARLPIDEMTDGVEYEMWVVFYGTGTERDLGDLDNVNIHVDFERFDSNLKGSFDINGEFDLTVEEGAAVFLTIEKNGDTLTIRDSDGNVISEG